MGETRKQLRNHLVSAHNFKGCDICGKSFFRQLNLKRHRLKHTAQKEGNIDRANKVYTAEFKIDAVKRVHDIGLAKTSRHLKLSQTTLKKWRNIIHSPFQCTMCGKEFSNNSDLQKHVEYHHSEDGERKKIINKHQCEKCSRSFSRSNNLKRH